MNYHLHNFKVSGTKADFINNDQSILEKKIRDAHKKMDDEKSSKIMQNRLEAIKKEKALKNGES